MMKIINRYICVMVLLFTFTGYAQWFEGVGGNAPYYGSNTPPGYASPFTFTGTNQLTGVTITTAPSGPNWGNINAQADAQLAAQQAAVNANIPKQPVIPPPTGGIIASAPPKPTTPPTPKPDPCAQAKSASVLTTAISKDANFTSAKNSIATASTADGLEHGITLGRNSSGQITQAPMKTGGPFNVPVNTSWPGAFAALHNHINNTPPSSGDIYTAVKLNTISPNFTTSFINLPDGSSYAIVVTNLVAAQNFVATYPADQAPGYSPEFPDFIFDQLQVLVTPMGSTVDGRTMAIAFVLDKYNAGIALLKQDSSGEFKAIKAQETTQADGSKTYTSIPCN